MATHTHTTHFLKDLLHFSPSRFWIGSGFNILASLSSGFGLVLLVPLLHASGWLPGAEATTLFGGTLTPLFQGLSPQTSLFVVVGLFLTIGGLSSTFDFLQHQYSTRLRLDYLFSLRQRLYTAISHARWAHLNQQRHSDVEQLMSSGLLQLSSLSASSLKVISDGILLLIYLGFSCAVSPLLTGVALIMASLGLWVSRKKHLFESGQHDLQTSLSLHHTLSRFLDGIKLAKASHRVPYYLDRFDHINQRSTHIQYQYTRQHKHAHWMLQLLALIMLSTILLVSLLWLHTPLASLVTLFLLFGRLIPRLSGLRQAYFQMVTYAPVFEHYTQLLEACHAQQEPQAPPQDLVFTQSIHCNALTVSHPDSGFTLGPLTGTIPINTTLAIVGASGSGKSTLADTLLGLLSPTSGQLTVDDTPLGPQHLAAWRDQLSYVPQESVLIHGTLRENLCWGGTSYSDKALWGALELVELHTIANTFPEGLDTFIGERGAQMSGGQRQRLALARAILKAPKLLILDEATNALDPPSEAAIYKALNRLQGTMTMIIISHRYDTICHADTIWVLDQGQRIEWGTANDLLANPNSRFSNLFSPSVSPSEKRGTSS